jgi:hypothetical protein
MFIVAKICALLHQHWTEANVVQKCITWLSVGGGQMMIGNSFRTEQNIRTTSLHQGCQCLTHFNVIMKAFSKLDRSCINR